jgi:hypothetical protein
MVLEVLGIDKGVVVLHRVHGGQTDVWVRNCGPEEGPAVDQDVKREWAVCRRCEDRDNPWVKGSDSLGL